MKLIDAHDIEYEHICGEFRVSEEKINAMPTVFDTDNATNGDVIKALFPNEHDFETDFDEDWWNAPYTYN